MSSQTLLVSLFFLLSWFLQSAQARFTGDWTDLEFLLGEWTWVGVGQPGQAKGVCTFRPELDGTVLMRKTHLDYAATKERAGFAHDDLLYVYHDPEDTSLRAIFFDGEGHVIRYRVTVASGGDSVEFLSDAAPAGTRCRLTYRTAGADSVTEQFAIAPAGKPNDFSTYVEFRVTRVAR
jgi:hypothetical protein